MQPKLRRSTRAEAEDEPGHDLGPTVAVLGLEPPEIQQRASKHDLRFRESFDDLDGLSVASFRPSGSLRCALVRHAHAPKPGTHLVLQSPVVSDLASAVDAAIDWLGLTTGDVTWEHPLVTLSRKSPGERTLLARLLFGPPERLMEFLRKRQVSDPRNVGLT
jgi:hypothetical protein